MSKILPFILTVLMTTATSVTILAILFKYTFDSDAAYKSEGQVTSDIQVSLKAVHKEFKKRDQRLAALSLDVMKIKNRSCARSTAEYSDLEGELPDQTSPKTEVEQRNAEIKYHALVSKKWETRLETEPRSLGGAVEAENLIRSTFEGFAIEGTAVENVYCSDNTCRVSVTHETPTNISRFVDKLIKDSPFDGAMFVPKLPEEESQQRSIVYYTRADNKIAFNNLENGT